MKGRFLSVAALTLAVVPLCHGQKEQKPKCVGSYLSLYVEGTLQLTSVPKEACPIPNPCSVPHAEDSGSLSEGRPQVPVHGELLVPTEPSENTSSKALRFCVRVKDGTWRTQSVPYDQITSLSYGFIPQGAILTTTGATIISTSVSASTAVLAISNGINKTWKVGLGATGIGIAALVGIRAAWLAGFPFKGTQRKEWYYLVVNFNSNPDRVKDERSHAVSWDYSKTYYAPQGSLAVFAMDVESFWPTVLLLQSGTGIPLGSLPVPGQSGTGK
jgi:hypothetical protein